MRTFAITSNECCFNYTKHTESNNRLSCRYFIIITGAAYGWLRLPEGSCLNLKLHTRSIRKSQYHHLPYFLPWALPAILPLCGDWRLIVREWLTAGVTIDTERILFQRQCTGLWLTHWVTIETLKCVGRGSYVKYILTLKKQFRVI